MNILLVNTVAATGSIGRYISRIARRAVAAGHRVCVAAGSGTPDVEGVEHIAIGGTASRLVAGMATRLFDSHGLTGERATHRFIEQAQAFEPDVVHLHNIHGYYLCYPPLFKWLVFNGLRTLWSLHDCWALTGHCAFFDRRHCTGWQGDCAGCRAREAYPATLFAVRGKRNKALKQRIFHSGADITLLPVSEWLANDILPLSHLADLPRELMKIDVDISTFRPTDGPHTGVLGVAQVWNADKNLDFFRRLRRELPCEVPIRIAGNLRGQRLPEGIEHLGCISSIDAMARTYAAAAVFVNPTLADNYPLTNREALACGTPVVSRTVGGALEDIATCPAVASGHTDTDLIAAVRSLLSHQDQATLRHAARAHTEALYAHEPWLTRLLALYTNR